MKNRKKGLFRRICIIAGIGLLAAGAVVLFSWQHGISSSAERSLANVEVLRTLMPDPQGAALEERKDNTMPVISIDGTDFIGIIEMPSHDLKLPVCADWGNPSKQPCRFDGSIYDGSIEIGGTSQKGQFNFYRDISVGDSVYFTDMTGNRYAYLVSDIDYVRHVDETTLKSEEDELTIFIKNVYAFEYVIIFCNI